jgi:multidrug efflux pump subunit AcrB
MTLAALLFFLPPAALLYRAAKEKDSHTLQLIRNLSALSLVLTAVLLVVNFLTALSSEALGNFFHGMLVVVSSPMVCSGHWALSLFCWACLLMVCLQEQKKGKKKK